MNGADGPTRGARRGGREVYEGAEARERDVEDADVAVDASMVVSRRRALPVVEPEDRGNVRTHASRSYHTFVSHVRITRSHVHARV